MHSTENRITFNTSNNNKTSAIMAWAKKTSDTVKHNHLCSMAFGKPSKHDDCPRCQELKNGAEARKGWSAPVVSGLSAYCFSVAIHHGRCTAETNPSCACGKMSYTD